MVAEQHEARSRGFAGERAVRGIVDRDRVAAALTVERAGAGGEHEHVARHALERLPGHVAGSDGIGESRSEPSSWTRHLEPEPGVRGGRGRVGGEPVGHDHAVESPLVVQQRAEQPWMLGAVRAAEPVVGGHHRPAPSHAECGLERDQVQLAQGALVDLGRDRHALVLGVVGDEVLHRRADTGRLHAAHVRGGEHGAQVRVLAEALEVASGQRMAVQVDGRGEEHVRALGARLLPERDADARDERRVPRRAEGAAAGEACRAEPGPARATRPVGSVGEA